MLWIMCTCPRLDPTKRCLSLRASERRVEARWLGGRRVARQAFVDVSHTYHVNTPPPPVWLTATREWEGHVWLVADLDGAVVGAGVEEARVVEDGVALAVLATAGGAKQGGVDGAAVLAEERSELEHLGAEGDLPLAEGAVGHEGPEEARRLQQQTHDGRLVAEHLLHKLACRRTKTGSGMRLSSHPTKASI